MSSGDELVWTAWMVAGLARNSACWCLGCTNVLGSEDKGFSVGMLLERLLGHSNRVWTVAQGKTAVLNKSPQIRINNKK